MRRCGYASRDASEVERPPWRPERKRRRKLSLPPPPEKSCAGDRRLNSALGLQLTSRFLARTLVALDFVGNLLVFIEAAQARLFDGRDVDENVLAAVVRLDEAVALGAVEPFYSAGSHFQDLR